MILIVLLASSSSCDYKPVEYDPNFFVGRHIGEYVVDRNGTVIYCTEEAFSQMGCLTKDKIKELADILDNAVVPKDYKLLKKENLNYLRNALERMSHDNYPD